LQKRKRILYFFGSRARFFSCFFLTLTFQGISVSLLLIINYIAKYRKMQYIIAFFCKKARHYSKTLLSVLFMDTIMEASKLEEFNAKARSREFFKIWHSQTLKRFFLLLHLAI